jgi:hypothetical protein
VRRTNEIDHVNLKTAKALDVSIQTNAIAIADEVIE